MSNPSPPSHPHFGQKSPIWHNLFMKKKLISENFIFNAEFFADTTKKCYNSGFCHCHWERGLKFAIWHTRVKVQTLIFSKNLRGVRPPPIWHPSISGGGVEWAFWFLDFFWIFFLIFSASHEENVKIFIICIKFSCVKLSFFGFLAMWFFFEFFFWFSARYTRKMLKFL